LVLSLFFGARPNILPPLSEMREGGLLAKVVEPSPPPPPLLRVEERWGGGGQSWWRSEWGRERVCLAEARSLCRGPEVRQRCSMMWAVLGRTFLLCRESVGENFLLFA
jgi:hypothetical protein